MDLGVHPVCFTSLLASAFGRRECHHHQRHSRRSCENLGPSRRGRHDVVTLRPRTSRPEQGKSKHAGERSVQRTALSVCTRSKVQKAGLLLALSVRDDFSTSVVPRCISSAMRVSICLCACVSACNACVSQCALSHDPVTRAKSSVRACAAWPQSAVNALCSCAAALCARD